MPNDSKLQPSARLISDCLGLIGRHSQGNDQLVAIHARLAQIYRRDRIRLSRRLKTLASYNGLTGTIKLNSRSLPFLNFDYHVRLQGLPQNSELRSKLETLRFRQLIQLSGILVHEGQHAYQPVRSFWSPRRAMALDEVQALNSEQLWYQRLYERVDPKYHEELYQLALSTESDAENARAYSRLQISAPNRIPKQYQPRDS